MLKAFSQSAPADGKTPEMVNIIVDGRQLAVPAGISVAAALLGNAEHSCFCKSRPESAGAAEAREPYCLMGVCFDCLAEINGIPDQQSCLVTVREGMQIRRPGQSVAGFEPLLSPTPTGGDQHA